MTKSACVVLFMAFLGFGCTFQRVVLNQPIDKEDVKFIVPNQTTMEQVVARIGAPDEISDIGGDHLLFRYSFSSVKSVRVDFGWIGRFWSPVTPPMNLGWSSGGVDVFLVAFNRDLIASDFAFGRLDETKDVSFWPF